MNLQIEKTKELLKKTDLHNERVSIIYSADSTLKKGKFYFLGQNPGGNKEYKYGEDSILNQLIYSGEHNEYTEGEWTGTKGKIHQYNIKKMFSDLEVQLENVFSTNLSFIRSSRTETYERNLKDDYNTFWFIHEFFLSVVKPRFIITNGAQPRDFFRKKMPKLKDDKKKEMKSDGRYNHVASFFTGALQTDYETFDELTILAIPHLSNVTNNINDYEEYYKEGVLWLKKRLNAE